MNSESKQCQNCKQNFTIESEDFDFYKKIDVPAPTWCPECRFIRRYIWRNERAFYKRKCDVKGHTENMISMYAPEKDYTVYDDRYWWSDHWDALDYGKEYDFSKSFFKQYEELLKKIPLIGLSVTNNINSSYCNVSAWDKGCYMISASGKNEDVFYSNRVAYTKDSYDVYISDKNQSCYESVNCTNCFRVSFCIQSRDCLESQLLLDCANCQRCLGCVGLRNKSYHIFNQAYSKEEYSKKVKESDLGSFQSLALISNKFQSFSKQFPRKFASAVNCVNTTGDNVKNSKNARFCFDASGVEDGKFFTWVYATLKDSYDVGAGSGIDDERLYECWDTNQCSDTRFSGVMYGCYNAFYCWNCHGSNNLFACVGLRNKQYCILNKQYTKEEYEALVPRIIKHMNDMPYVDKKGRVYKYGEFFPPELSPFCYNETIAQEYFPLTKEEAIEKGYRWKDPETKDYKPTIKAEALPDHIKDVKDDIVGKVIECANAKSEIRSARSETNSKFKIQNSEFSNCTTAFRIIPQELEFYRRMNLPLPRLCPNCRHYERLKQRNPLKLWHRKCQCVGKTSENGVYTNPSRHQHGDGPCPNEFETSYSPDRPEIVYCEACYQSEVA